jgi:PadR family transcriptional regulator, regulatory protein PadR
MGRNYLGEFEELVLLSVAVDSGQAYAAAMTQELKTQTGRTVQLSAVHIALYRLEEKGLVTSIVGGATAVRGGRRKRLFAITALDRQTLADIRAVREQFWQLIPKPL